MRYIRIFDVISQLLRFFKEEAEIQHQALPFVKRSQARYIRTFEAFSEHERRPLGVSTLLCVF